MLGTPRNGIARVNADGTVDAGFDPKPNLDVISVAVQADGKVLLCGYFRTLQPNGAVTATTRQHIARVHADGTLDMGFDPKADFYVNSLAIQPDGKVLLCGQFTTLQPNGAAQPTARRHLARVNPDGTLDTGFAPEPNAQVYTAVVQTDGRILLCGSFIRLWPNGASAPTTRQYIARINADGTPDPGFDPKANHPVSCVAAQADGRVVLAGTFTTLQPNGAASPVARRYVARVHADGTLDTGFDPSANGRPRSVAVQADGKLLLAGEFTTLQPNGAASPTPRPYVARIHADGTLDAGFDPKANGECFTMALQADGKVLLGGGFTTLQPNGAASPTTRHKFARLDNDPATQTLSAPGATQVRWERGGTAPEFSRITFELSTDGGANWSPLGAGNRIGATANWQLTGLALPATGQLRARGVTPSGHLNGSSGLIERVAAFNFTTDADADGLLDSWELTYWPTTAGHSAGDDFDHDGLAELQELAFGLDPTQPDAARAPCVVAEGGYLTITLSKQPGVSYEVQSAGALGETFSAATTTVLLDTATTLKVRDNFLIGTAPARFLRVQVTAAP